MATIYRDPIIHRLIDVFNAEGPAKLKGRYYSGDPLMVPKSVLPAVFITKDKSTIANTSNAEDEASISLVINVVFDLTKDFNQTTDIGSTNSLYEVVEARNPDLTLRSDCLVYVIRKHQQLGPKLWLALRDAVEDDFGVGIEKRGPGMFSVEATVKVTVTHHQIRPGLQA